MAWENMKGELDYIGIESAYAKVSKGLCFSYSHGLGEN